MFCIMRTEKRKRTDIGGIQRENTRTGLKRLTGNGTALNWNRDNFE